MTNTKELKKAFRELLKQIEAATAERDEAIATRTAMQMRCLNVRDALNAYHKTKTCAAVDELERVAAGCNTPDLLYNFSDYVHREDRVGLNQALKELKS